MIIVGLFSAFIAFIPIALFGILWWLVFLFGYPVQWAHYAGLTGLWAGVAVNYLLGKIFARLFIIG